MTTKQQAEPAGYFWRDGCSHAECPHRRPLTADVPHGAKEYSTVQAGVGLQFRTQAPGCSRRLPTTREEQPCLAR